MKIKTSELIGPALDWAVAKCEGQDVGQPTGTPYWLVKADTNAFGERRVAHPDYGGEVYAPSKDWAQGGPIIEREMCFPIRGGQEGFVAYSYKTNRDFVGHGPTPLIAAMRCFVAQLTCGDEVDIPEELT